MIGVEALLSAWAFEELGQPLAEGTEHMAFHIRRCSLHIRAALSGRDPLGTSVKLPKKGTVSQ